MKQFSYTRTVPFVPGTELSEASVNSPFETPRIELNPQACFQIVDKRIKRDPFGLGRGILVGGSRAVPGIERREAIYCMHLHCMLFTLNGMVCVAGVRLLWPLILVFRLYSQSHCLLSCYWQMSLALF